MVSPGINYTRPGGGQTAGGNNGEGEWVGWSLLDVDSVDTPEPGFVLSDQIGDPDGYS